MGKLNLGDPEYNRKMMIYYSWVAPIILAGMMVLFLITKAWVPALLMAADAVLTLPPMETYLKSLRISGGIKLILGIILVVAAFYFTNLYV